jgi:hypothetical protein
VALTGNALHAYGLAGMNARSTVFMLALLACATGMWLTLGLAHLRAALLVPAWFLAVGAVATLDYTIPRALVALLGPFGPTGPPPSSGREALSRLLVALGLMAATLLAAGAGSIVRGTEPAMRSRRWRNRLARHRKLRASA